MRFISEVGRRIGISGDPKPQDKDIANPRLKAFLDGLENSINSYPYWPLKVRDVVVSGILGPLGLTKKVQSEIVHEIVRRGIVDAPNNGTDFGRRISYAAGFDKDHFRALAALSWGYVGSWSDDLTTIVNRTRKALGEDPIAQLIHDPIAPEERPKPKKREKQAVVKNTIADSSLREIPLGHRAGIVFEDGRNRTSVESKGRIQAENPQLQAFLDGMRERFLYTEDYPINTQDFWTDWRIRGEIQARLELNVRQIEVVARAARGGGMIKPEKVPTQRRHMQLINMYDEERTIAAFTLLWSAAQYFSSEKGKSPSTTVADWEAVAGIARGALGPMHPVTAFIHDPSDAVTKLRWGVLSSGRPKQKETSDKSIRFSNPRRPSLALDTAKVSAGSADEDSKNNGNKHEPKIPASLDPPMEKNEVMVLLGSEDSESIMRLRDTIHQQYKHADRFIDFNDLGRSGFAIAQLVMRSTAIFARSVDKFDPTLAKLTAQRLLDGLDIFQDRFLSQTKGNIFNGAQLLQMVDFMEQTERERLVKKRG